MMGDVSCFIVAAAPENEHGIQLHGHANFHYISDKSQPRISALYLNGICCTPFRSGRGLGAALLTKSLRQLSNEGASQRTHFALRTMNLGMIKSAKRAIGKAFGKPVLMYPLDSDLDQQVVRHESDSRGRETRDIVQMAEVISAWYSWDSLDPKTLVMPKAYPPSLVPFFLPAQAQDAAACSITLEGGPTELPAWQERFSALIDQQQGDAILCITRI
jgi:hypothetical protein